MYTLKLTFCNLKHGNWKYLNYITQSLKIELIIKCLVWKLIIIIIVE